MLRARMNAYKWSRKKRNSWKETAHWCAWEQMQTSEAILCRFTDEKRDHVRNAAQTWEILSNSHKPNLRSERKRKKRHYTYSSQKKKKKKKKNRKRSQILDGNKQKPVYKKELAWEFRRWKNFAEGKQERWGGEQRKEDLLW